VFLDIRYGLDFATATQIKLLEKELTHEVDLRIIDILNENNINLDNLII
jgi:hypothetical protein